MVFDAQLASAAMAVNWKKMDDDGSGNID
eukprot:COSAG02_NODE_27764_length_603_cov_0.718254_1_plen_28_part_10